MRHKIKMKPKRTHLKIDHKSSEPFNILIASDLHIGYKESDDVRGKDTYNTFNEILSIAKEKDVDFILLGGDLFHENKPSRYSMYNTICALRKYCFGDKNIAFEYIENCDLNHNHNFQHPNFLDHNLHVSIPIFSIHGNHDDPTGELSLCTLNLLSSSGLMNYFGKMTNFEDIRISPIILKKGNTQVAIYGLGNIKDTVLFELFLNGKVVFDKPDNYYDHYNIFVLHQNRAVHGKKNYIPENVIPEFIDLVLWGHEHECLIDMVPLGPSSVYITQPGSTVITALSQGEETPKHVGILEVNGKKGNMMSIQLKTSRIFLMKDVSTDDVMDDDEYSAMSQSDILKNFCRSHIQKMIQDYSKKLENGFYLPREPIDLKPLLRLRVFYKPEENIIDSKRISLEFQKNVANGESIVMFAKKRDLKNSESNTVKFRSYEETNHDIIELTKKRLMDLDEENNLCVLNIDTISTSLSEFIAKYEKDSIKNALSKSLKAIQTHLKLREVVSENLKKEIIMYNSSIMELELKSQSSNNKNINEDHGTKFDFEDEPPKKIKKRGRGRPNKYIH
ncbi:Double-strand break repair protein MRE11 [Intoshia linei]|uniref:Double-strand break repair protein MRE11 n=1 Tax=Intoshia linei TaxID=1819745 RepID=A0A177ATK5_9BILA|nr:Double-strand break repair protein MRE11 [Intoshia linei]